ncbi:hypothetical protein CDL12_14667 [Handroanthus impetiginosus]|uniref:Adiponectin receptor n=1 Tax=Handroanthus impetiginosus TaxID=429701 RepID=A0A2G9H5D5_9LAMI|nr:hypothetical protein CDL12_14667 [Handroanthus impetiginosus]
MYHIFSSSPATAIRIKCRISLRVQEFFPGTNKIARPESRIHSANAHNHLSAPTPNWPFYTFLSGSMLCLFSSTICHLFSCHSKTIHSHLLYLDNIGIAIMIIGSLLRPVYYIFHCTPHFQILYLTGITLIGIFTIFTLLSPALSTAKYRSICAMLFDSMGLFGLIPAVHDLAINWNDPHRNVLLGTVFYVRRIPERWMPGWFDLAGHSRQIFHVFVVMGTLAHYGAAQAFMRTRVACDAVAIA